MADFVEDSTVNPHEKGEPEVASSLVDVNNPVRVLYCGVCSMPPEFCEYGACFDQCLPWIQQHCPEVLSEEHLSQALGKATISEEGEAQAEEEVLFLLKVTTKNDYHSYIG